MRARMTFVIAFAAVAFAGLCSGCKSDETAESNTPAAPPSAPAVTTAPAAGSTTAGGTSASAPGTAGAASAAAGAGTGAGAAKAGGSAAAKASEETQPGKNPIVELDTSTGKIRIQLDPAKAPITTKNFLTYVNSGFYNGTIFHRVIPNFMIQGGGFTPDMAEKQAKEPIRNEGGNGLKNNRGTIAMARTSDPDSAAAQFFINLKDNDFLNRTEGNAGYAVFGKVISGMDIVDKIAQVKTGTKGQFENVPDETVEIKSAKVVAK
jgi:peptidyl-prolyl cis-trans isomerase A (cyclophilin A)